MWDIYTHSLCRSTFSYDSEDTAESFPRAGTYRVDVCIESGEESYDVRLKFIVSGANANDTWETADVDSSETGLEVYSESGAEITTSEELKDLLTDDPTGTVFTIRSGTGATTHLSVRLQIICVESVRSCPTPFETCD